MPLWSHLSHDPEASPLARLVVPSLESIYIYIYICLPLNEI